MTDREMLELAAEAYGAAQFPEDGPWEYFFERLPGGDGLDFRCWNPIISDGDALRLAVKLDLFDAPRYRHERDVLMFTQGVDKLSAARRAIVRATAEIGKAMVENRAA
jgi:hypothetical protein